MPSCCVPLSFMHIYVYNHTLPRCVLHCHIKPAQAKVPIVNDEDECTPAKQQFKITQALKQPQDHLPFVIAFNFL